jgi:hypothetical protein
VNAQRRRINKTQDRLKSWMKVWAKKESKMMARK